MNIKITEDNSGWRRSLSSGLVYRATQFVFSEKRSKKFIVDRYLNQFESGNRSILDMGCGPGNIIPYLPSDVAYTGFDISAEYVEQAGKLAKNRSDANVYCGYADEMMDHPDISDASYDFALVHGVFHHVSDEVMGQIIELAGKKLRSGGVLLALEPTWLENQSLIRANVMKLDRGKNIKFKDEWVCEFEKNTAAWAQKQECSVRSDLISFYDLVVLSATKS